MPLAFERQVTFHPDRELRADPGRFGLSYESVRLTAADGESISGWLVPAAAPVATLLFLHGNAGNMGDRVTDVAAFAAAGFSVLIIDYRGYGLSSGSPSEEGVYADARAAWDFLTGARRVPPGRIVLLGESLGCAAALHLAADLRRSGDAPPGALVLAGAFTSALDMGRHHFPFLPVRWLVRQRFDNLSAVRAIDAPVLFVHGQADDVVPVEMGRRLFEASASPLKRMRELPLAGHATLFEGGAPLVREIGRFVRAALGGDPGPGDARGADD